MAIKIVLETIQKPSTSEIIQYIAYIFIQRQSFTNFIFDFSKIAMVR